jgi:hypothetical protein
VQCLGGRGHPVDRSSRPGDGPDTGAGHRHDPGRVGDVHHVDVDFRGHDHHVRAHGDIHTVGDDHTDHELDVQYHEHNRTGPVASSEHAAAPRWVRAVRTR